MNPKAFSGSEAGPYGNHRSIYASAIGLRVFLSFFGGGGGGVRVWGLGFRVFFKKTNKLDIPTKSLIPEPLPLKP